MVILDCKTISQEILETTKSLIEMSKVKPVMNIVNVNPNVSNTVYQKQIIKYAEYVGIICKVTDFVDNYADGIIILNPHDKISANILLYPDQDIDGITQMSLGGLIYNGFIPKGFIPCTAEAVMKVFEYHHIDLVGKNAVIVGRSTTIGKPLSMLMLNSDVTVTICHSKTKNIDRITKNADIVVLATNQIAYYDSKFFNKDTIVIDCGFGMNEKTGKMSGCLDADEINSSNAISAYTSVPGGIGVITPALLCDHTYRASLMNIIY